MSVGRDLLNVLARARRRRAPLLALVGTITCASALLYVLRPAFWRCGSASPSGHVQFVADRGASTNTVFAALSSAPSVVTAFAFSNTVLTMLSGYYGVPDAFRRKHLAEAIILFPDRSCVILSSHERGIAGQARWSVREYCTWHPISQGIRIASSDPLDLSLLLAASAATHDIDILLVPSSESMPEDWPTALLLTESVAWKKKMGQTSWKDVARRLELPATEAYRDSSWKLVRDEVIEHYSGDPGLEEVRRQSIRQGVETETLP